MAFCDRGADRGVRDLPGRRRGLGKTTIEADLIGALNPDGLMVRVIGSRRWAPAASSPAPSRPTSRAD